MTQRTLVSVVIPCYNSGATIEQTVASVRGQSWEEVEVVVIDDGSSDPQTVEVLSRLQGVRLIRQENSGLPAARNRGFEAANGHFVLPLDADDWIEPDAIESLMRALQTQQDCAFAYAHMQMEGEASGVLRKSYNFFEQLFLNQMPYCLLIPKSVWQEVGGYDASMRRGYEDWEFNIRLGARGYFGTVVPRPLFHYRVASSGMLISQSNRLHGALWREIQDRHPGLYRWPSIFSQWRLWRGRPSTYPLRLYFLWLAAHRVLPEAMFGAMFRWLRDRSHSKRVTARAAGG
ncbi:glycosyltransferase [Nitrogeniibacter aestuarii]|nr:glycosyltransferase [Nitrogeniibacter aestuarii]